MRLAVSDNLKYLSEMRLHPSFTSTEAFFSACRAKNGMQLLIAVDDAYVQRIDQLVTSLQEWRKIRQPFSKDAVQPYDAACLTVLTWLWSGMNDYRVTAVYPFVERLLPELLHMHDLQDNQELVKWASVVLASMAALPYPAERVPNILDSLLDLFSSTSWRTRLAVLPLLQGERDDAASSALTNLFACSLLLPPAVCTHGRSDTQSRHDIVRTASRQPCERFDGPQTPA